MSFPPGRLCRRRKVTRGIPNTHDAFEKRRATRSVGDHPTARPCRPVGGPLPLADGTPPGGDAGAAVLRVDEAGDRRGLGDTEGEPYGIAVEGGDRRVPGSATRGAGCRRRHCAGVRCLLARDRPQQPRHERCSRRPPPDHHVPWASEGIRPGSPPPFTANAGEIESVFAQIKSIRRGAGRPQQQDPRWCPPADLGPSAGSPCPARADAGHRPFRHRLTRRCREGRPAGHRRPGCSPSQPGDGAPVTSPT